MERECLGDAGRLGQVLLALFQVEAGFSFKADG